MCVTYMVKLINGDCLEVMKDLTDKSIDLVVVDLPYGCLNGKAKLWDKAIDLEKMWVELKKVCKKNCIYCFFTTTKYGCDLINSNPKWFRYDLVWEKPRAVGYLSSKKAPLRAHELIYVFGNPNCSNKTYNPQMKTGKPYEIKQQKTNLNYANVKNLNHTINEGTRFPRSVIKFSRDKFSKHSTQKPVDLCEWLIKTYSNEEDTVLDFTMGSGSTGEACVNINRQFIGIEKDEEIFKIAYDRLIHLNI